MQLGAFSVLRNTNVHACVCVCVCVCVCIYIYIFIYLFIYFLETLAVIGKFQLLMHRTSEYFPFGKLAKFLTYFVSRQGILNSGRNEMHVLLLNSATLQTGWAYSNLGKWCPVKKEHHFHFCP